VTLRAKLTVAFALFAAVPMLVPLYWVNRALSDALSAEYGARLESAARAVEGEVRRLSTEAAAGARELARSPELEGLARDRVAGQLDVAEAAARAKEWMAARSLDVLAVAEPTGQVVSSGHLPGRAGDVDPELGALFSESPPGAAVARFVSRATPSGVEPVLALVAWEPVAGDLRVAAGIALGPSFAERLGALTGGDVTLVDQSTARPLASYPAQGARLRVFLSRFLRLPQGQVRSIPLSPLSPLGPNTRPLAHVEMTLSAAGLARAETTVVVAFLSALALAVLAATLLGHALAGRITLPLEALRAGALRVASGDLSRQVEARATGEVADLVAAFNAMVADLASSRARAAAAERVAAWREVARRLAHEIKNPLTPIAMSVETLRDALEGGRPDFKEIFDEGTAAIQQEVRRLKRIVDEFSRFARLPAPELAPVAPEELVDALLALYPAPPSGIRIEREVAPSLPKVNADRDQILQLLLNLAANGVEAMGAAGGVLRIGAAALSGAGAGAVLFSVADTGPGIAPDELQRIFEPYFTTKEGGTGLGLAIAERIATEHGGRLTVESELGRGATFTLRLPAAAG
jgi:signal transduction histidine kinase